MNSINDILSEGLQVKPLEGDQKQEFRLAIFGTIDPITEQPCRKPGYTLAGIDRIMDALDKKSPGMNKLIYNIKDFKPIRMQNGETIMQPEPGYVTFDGSGIIICTPESNDLYIYLKRHNKNRDNPYRNRKKPVIFYEVDEKRDLMVAKNSFEYKIHAGGHLLSADDNELSTLAYRLNALKKPDLSIPTNLRGGLLRNFLQPFSQTHPELILLFSGSEEQQARVIIDYAIQHQWILFSDHEDIRTWVWMRNAGKPGKVNIVKVEPGDDPRKFLMSFLITREGSQHFAELRKRHSEEFRYEEIV